MHSTGRWERSLLAFVVTLTFAFGATALAERELVVAQGIDVEGFDVHAHSTTAVEAIHVNIFDYLIMRDADGEWQPALATEWEPAGETAWRFVLRDDVVWHDGEPFTGEDVKFTFERVANDDTLDQWESFRQIREVEVVSDHEILIHTEFPDPILLNRVSRLGSSILPKHYIEEVGWEEFTVNPVGTGPFQFVEWRRDDRIIMEAFDDHWRGRPHWDRLVHRTIPEDSTRVGELLTGGVHVATNIPTHDADRVEGSGVARVEPWPTTRIMMYVFNAEGEGTDDPRVREAIDYAIDSEVLIDALMDGLGTPVRGRLSPGISGAPMDLYDDQNYDPERSVALLEEAGYGPGELTIKVEGPSGRYPLDAEIVELTGVMLEQVGIDVEMEILEWSAFLDRVWNADNITHMALIGLANSMYDGWFAMRAILCDGTYRDRVNWCNEEFDALMNEAEQEVDLERRTELLSEAFYLVERERPWITMFQLENLAGVSADIDWSPRPDELLWMFGAQPAN